MSDLSLPTSDFDFSTMHMARALELAARGQSHVEPNPMVGCVLVDDSGVIVGEGYHRKFGGDHAEVEALRIAGKRARGATMFVTLEPCCHFGKTPPCTKAIIAAGVNRVVAGMRDPYPQVAGGGFDELQAAGTEVAVGLLEAEVRDLNAPYLKLLATGWPWVIAKWAMTLDGKIASRAGSSRWISGEASRGIVHALRGRMDAIIVGRGTAAKDDPLLTARPAGPRVAMRIVIDSKASLASELHLVTTARETPTMIAVSTDATADNRSRLEAAGCEVFLCNGSSHKARLESLLSELGRRRMTNVLVEGGGKLLGSLFDLHIIDEFHAFIAPKLIGGTGAPSPIGGEGIASMSNAAELESPTIEIIGGDVYLHGRLR